MTTKSKAKAAEYTVETVTQSFEQGFEFARKQMDEMVQSIGQVSAFSKANADAVFASTQAAFQGVEVLNAEFVALSKKILEEGATTTKGFSDVKTVSDFAEAQNKLMKEGFDQFVAESGRLSEMTLKAYNDVLQPMSARASEAFESLTQPRSR